MTFQPTTRLTMLEAVEALNTAPVDLQNKIRARISRYVLLHGGDYKDAGEIVRQNFMRDMIRQSVSDEANEVPMPEVPDQKEEPYQPSPSSTLNGLTVSPLDCPRNGHKIGRGINGSHE